MVALWRSTRTRKASRSPASVRSMAMASAARTLSTLSFIRILRQVFSLAVRSTKQLMAHFALLIRLKLYAFAVGLFLPLKLAFALAVGWPLLAGFSRVGPFLSIPVSDQPTRKSHAGLKYRIITVDLRTKSPA